MSQIQNKKMSDEERIALAAKLDKELDEFIDGLEKRRYTEGWPEDRWQEEMDKHPFFMKKAPDENDELHPLLEGIRQLKYDPEENTAEDLASSYKEDGNFYMKHKKFRMAILSFTEGLKTKCSNNEVNAALYNNRSAAQFFLKNYRSSLLDAKKAIELKPNYTKAMLRVSQCLYNLKKFDDCLEYCDKILGQDSSNEHVKDLYEKCKIKKKEIEEYTKQLTELEERRERQIDKTIKELKKRCIKFDDIPEKGELSEEFIRPKLLPLEDFLIQVDDKGNLTWPVAFSYPEFLITDFQQKLDENVIMRDVLQEIFAEPFEHDKELKYQPDNVTVYYENRREATVHKVDKNKTIKEIIQEENFYVSGGCLSFYVVPTESEVEAKYINETRRPLIV